MSSEVWEVTLLPFLNSVIANSRSFSLTPLSLNKLAASSLPLIIPNNKCSIETKSSFIFEANTEAICTVEEALCERNCPPSPDTFGYDSRILSNANVNILRFKPSFFSKKGVTFSSTRRIALSMWAFSMDCC